MCSVYNYVSLGVSQIREINNGFKEKKNTTTIYSCFTNMLVLSMYMFKARPPSVGNYVYIGHYIYLVVYILVTPNLTVQIRRLLGAFMSPSLTIASLTITRQI